MSTQRALLGIERNIGGRHGGQEHHLAYWLLVFTGVEAQELQSRNKAVSCGTYCLLPERHLRELVGGLVDG